MNKLTLKRTAYAAGVIRAVGTSSVVLPVVDDALGEGAFALSTVDALLRWHLTHHLDYQSVTVAGPLEVPVVVIVALDRFAQWLLVAVPFAHVTLERRLFVEPLDVLVGSAS